MGSSAGWGLCRNHRRLPWQGAGHGTGTSSFSHLRSTLGWGQLSSHTKKQPAWRGTSQNCTTCSPGTSLSLILHTRNSALCLLCFFGCPSWFCPSWQDTDPVTATSPTGMGAYSHPDPQGSPSLGHTLGSPSCPSHPHSQGGSIFVNLQLSSPGKLSHAGTAEPQAPLPTPQFRCPQYPQRS